MYSRRDVSLFGNMDLTILFYYNYVDVSMEDYESKQKETMAGNLLCDLKLWALHNNLNFDNINKYADLHYEREKGRLV